MAYTTLFRLNIPVPTPETAGEKKYRGAAYMEQTVAEAPVKERGGKYRGAEVKITNNTTVANPIRSSSLKYRGAGSANKDQ